jgi:hypothetical protein
VFLLADEMEQDAGLCEGKIVQFVAAEHERTPGLLFMVNSVSLPIVRRQMI